MKKIYLFIFSLVFIGWSCQKNQKKEVQANNVVENSMPSENKMEGAWFNEYVDSKGHTINVVAIVMDGYFATTYFDLEQKRFVKTFGGSYEVVNDTFKSVTEFNSSNPNIVGKSAAVKIKWLGDKLSFAGENKVWSRIDQGNTGVLAHPWLITGRKRGEELVVKDINDIGPRKTMKILSDTRFQWIAYNTETGDFFGTGGGTYKAEDGKYTENIEFFSRDSTRVGASLSFEYDIEDGQWHHKGLSSKGKPIEEVWSAR